MVFGQIVFIEHIYLIDACCHLSHNGEIKMYVTGVVMRNDLSADYAVPSLLLNYMEHGHKKYLFKRRFLRSEIDN